MHLRIARGAGWLLGQCAALSLRGLRAFAAWSRRHRGPLARSFERLAWWGALALVTLAGHDLVSGFASDTAFARIPWLALVAFALCAGVCFSTPASQLRKGAMVLGSGAAALGLLAWASTTIS